jgi:protein-S-isoprenylcysteine O-methyltransferase Ste14
VGFFALEGVFRRSGVASSLRADDGDRGTTRLIIAAYGAAAALPLVKALSRRRLPPAAGAASLVVQAGGLGLRAWSMRTLDRSYTRTLRTDGRDHALVETGPYRWVRHPGYAGSLLIWTGFALTSRSPLTVALTSALLGTAYARRIVVEEDLLGRELPGYRDYARRTSRLVPGIW